MKLDRLLGILTVLLQNRRVTAPYLAERFEVSRRTITRDIDALCMAGIPVVTTQGTGGGIAIAEGYKLDKSVLTANELHDIVASLRGLGSVTGKPQVERTLDKLIPGGDGAMVSLRESVVIDLASHAKNSLMEKIGQIKRAIQAGHTITFDYFYEKGDITRTIEPYTVVFMWSAWYVFGYCLTRDDWRLFKLSRLWGLRENSEAFAARQIPPDRVVTADRFPDEKRLVALLEPAQKYQLIDTYGPSCFTEEADGMLRLEIGYTNDDYMRRWLLSFGGAARVIEPVSMAEAIRREAEKMLGKQDI